MAKKREPTQVETTVGDAVSTCFSELESLGSEMREVCDNTPENLQGSDLYSRREEAADALENISEPTVPDSCMELPVKFAVMPSRRSSRSSRRDDAVRYAQEAIDVLNAMVEEWREAEKKLSKDETDPRISDAEALIDEVQSMIDDAEGVEFPGMFG